MEKFYAGGFLYNPDDRTVLLHKQDGKAKVNPNSWAFFGGLNEGQESPVKTFRREMQEELSLGLDETACIPLVDYFNEELQTHRFVFYVVSRVKKSELVLGEGEGFEWIPLIKIFEYPQTEKTARDLRTFISQRAQTA